MNYLVGNKLFEFEEDTKEVTAIHGNTRYILKQKIEGWTFVNESSLMLTEGAQTRGEAVYKALNLGCKVFSEGEEIITTHIADVKEVEMETTHP